MSSLPEFHARVTSLFEAQKMNAETIRDLLKRLQCILQSLPYRIDRTSSATVQFGGAASSTSRMHGSTCAPREAIAKLSV